MVRGGGFGVTVHELLAEVGCVVEGICVLFFHFFRWSDFSDRRGFGDCGMKGNSGGVVKGLNVLGVYAFQSTYKSKNWGIPKNKIKKGQVNPCQVHRLRKLKIKTFY